jgi:hypothetical protein
MANAEWRMPNAEVRMTSPGARQKVVWGSRVMIAIAFAVSLAALFALASCSDAVRTGQASSYMILQSITGGPNNSAVLQSDVISDKGTVFQDNGTATIQVAMKDPQGPAPTEVNAITITQYHVEFVRTDCINKVGGCQQGVDVPFAFDGGATATIAAGSTGTVAFTLVPVEAKLQAPLKALAHGGGQIVISTSARVTFYGHDQTGRTVSVTGNIEVDFADWAG